jgi:hypothetical protein
MNYDNETKIAGNRAVGLTSCVEERRGEIIDCLDILENKIAVLEDSISSLSVKLVPVVAQVPTCDNKQIAEVQSTTPIGARLASMITRIYYQTELLNRLLDQTEL